MRIFDTHTHLNDEAFTNNVPEQLAVAEELDVTNMAIVGSDEYLNQKALDLAHKYENLVAIVGFHPETAQNYDSNIRHHLIEQLHDDRTVALGEIGLDYHFGTEFKKEQQQVFEDQLQVAHEVGLPVSIHTRDATADTYDILQNNLPPKRGILHSFNESTEWMDKFLDLGMYISFSGVVTFKNAPIVQAAAKAVPLERMLVETDAPYLTPVPHRGKTNTPGYTRYVLEFISELRGVSIEEIAPQVFQNSLDVFGLKDV